MTTQEHRAAAYGIFPSDTQLEEVLTSLNSAGFQSADICVVLSPLHPIVDGVRSLKTSASSQSMEGKLETTVSWLASFGGVVIPGVGIFIGSREYLRALAQTDCLPEDSTNRVVLASLGIPESAAARCEERLRNDANLVFVSCEGSAHSEWAREILRRLRAEEVCSMETFERFDCESRKRPRQFVI